jgi:hypothetical protein
LREGAGRRGLTFRALCGDGDRLKHAFQVVGDLVIPKPKGKRGKTAGGETGRDSAI